MSVIDMWLLKSGRYRQVAVIKWLLFGVITGVKWLIVSLGGVYELDRVHS